MLSIPLRIRFYLNRKIKIDVEAEMSKIIEQLTGVKSIRLAINQVEFNGTRLTVPSPAVSSSGNKPRQ